MKLKVITVLVLALTLTSIPNSQAAAKVFKNCTELNKVYPGGVALPGAVNSGGKTKKVTAVNPKCPTGYKKK